MTDPHEAETLAEKIIALFEQPYHLVDHELYLGALAEGVENEAQARFLIEEGCQQAQGFHFCRPATPDGVAVFYREGQTHRMARANREQEDAL